ncbi:hypothetical protein [Bradyrhizobium sp.]|uniref:hypothetical protein n=1 Tax=Bradyrhizobium sp. TaxID=376 RepID=UPI003C587994
MKKAYERSHHRLAATIGIPCANGFNGLLRSLPGEPGFIASVACGDHHRLDTSVGVSGRHDFAVRDTRIRLVRRRVHRIFRPTFRDDRDTPLMRAEDARKNARDLPDVTSENVCGELTRRANQSPRANSCQVTSNCFVGWRSRLSGVSSKARSRMNLPIVWSKQLTWFRRIGHKLNYPREPFYRTKHLVVTAFRC